MPALALVLFGAAIFATGCDINVTINSDSLGDNIAGSGQLVTQKYDVASFTAVDVENALTLEIETDAGQRVEARFDDNLIAELEIDVRNQTLYLSCPKCSPSDDAVITVAMPSLERIGASGASHVQTSDIKTDEFTVELSGASRVDLNSLEAPAVSFKLSGASRAIINDGAVSELDASASGASSIAAALLEVAQLEVHLSGASRAEIAVKEEVSGTVSGASTLQLTGNFGPVEDLDVTGASQVQH